MASPQIATRTWVLDSSNDTTDVLVYFGLNNQTTVMNTDFRPSKRPEPDRRIVQRASAWLAFPASSGGNSAYYRTQGINLDFVTLTGDPGLEWVMPLKSCITGPTSPGILHGPLDLPYNIGVILWATGTDYAGYQLKVRVLYA